MRVVEDAPQVARDATGPLVSPEVVVIAALPLRATGTDANVQVRGVSARVLGVRDNVKLVEGRFLAPDWRRRSWGRAPATPIRGWTWGRDRADRGR